MKIINILLLVSEPGFVVKNIFTKLLIKVCHYNFNFQVSCFFGMTSILTFLYQMPSNEMHTSFVRFEVPKSMHIRRKLL